MNDNNRHKYLLKGAGRQIEMNTPPAITKEGEALVFDGEATKFLYNAYREGGVMADVRFTSLRREPHTGEWREYSNKKLNMLEWEMEDGFFRVKQVQHT